MGLAACVCVCVCVSAQADAWSAGMGKCPTFKFLSADTVHMELPVAPLRAAGSWLQLALAGAFQLI